MQLEIETPEWAEPFLKPSRYKAAFGGRGSGKSHFFAENLIERHLINPNCRSVGVREVQKSLNQSVKQLLTDKIVKFGLQDDFQVLDNVIKNRKGSGLIVFNGMQNHTGDSIKSLEGYDTAWIEEAASLSERSLGLLRPTIRKENSEIGATWNPYSEKDPIDKLFRSDDPPTGSIIKRVNYSDNPWFPDVLRQEMEYDRGRDIDKYDHVWLGGYVKNSEARVFQNWKIEEFELPEDAIFRYGADWGFSKDPSVLLRCAMIGRKIYFDYEAYMVGCEIVNLPDLFLTVPESEKWPIVADSSRPETISHMRKNGFPKIMPSIKGAGSIKDGVEFLKSYELIVHPRCKHLIDELTHYSYKVDDHTQQILPILEDKKNHVIDSARYALENVRRTSKQNKPKRANKLPFTKNYW